MEAQYKQHMFVDLKGKSYLVPLDMAPDCMDIMRIDMRKGYVPGNVVLCSHLAVMLRETFFEGVSFEEFKKLCKDVNFESKSSKRKESSLKTLC